MNVPVISDQAVGYCSHFLDQAVGYVPIIFDQAVSECSRNFGSVGWLLFPFFGSGYQLLFLLFWIRLFVTVPFILDQAVGDGSHYFGPGC